MRDATPLVTLDADAFDPWRIGEVRHRLCDHPLLRIDALIALAQRLEARRLVRSHSDAATAGSSFADAPNLHPNRRDAATTLSDLAHAHAWTSLLNVQADPVYRELVDAVLDALRPAIERRDPGLCYRAGWIFLSSPGAVTPFHIDHEHNVILQIAGRKRLYVWDPFDREVVSERAQEAFHDRHSREGVVWDEAFRGRARVFELEPGMGGYMPSTAPHMVENGDAPSITVSFTYYTDSTRRRELLYRGNAQLRRMGLSPRPVGASAAGDAIKAALLTTFTGAQRGLRRALGRGVRDNGLAYAPA
ncbi:MAG: cupin-like domain-containing protein [Xanthomonadales bacterium]|nr:cupin-like domain-containing protein [Xanthomonadales bacterium]